MKDKNGVGQICLVMFIYFFCVWKVCECACVSSLKGIIAHCEVYKVNLKLIVASISANQIICFTFLCSFVNRCHFPLIDIHKCVIQISDLNSFL